MCVGILILHTQMSLLAQHGQNPYLLLTIVNLSNVFTVKFFRMRSFVCCYIGVNMSTDILFSRKVLLCFQQKFIFYY